MKPKVYITAEFDLKKKEVNYHMRSTFRKPEHSLLFIGNFYHTLNEIYINIERAARWLVKNGDVRKEDMRSFLVESIGESIEVLEKYRDMVS